MNYFLEAHHVRVSVWHFRTSCYQLTLILFSDHQMAKNFEVLIA